jgi:predicted Ser/Thr protein kinase
MASRTTGGRLALKEGDRIGVWVVEAALGQGGMGSVYRCHHVEASRMRAAVKVLGPSLKDNTEALVRFVREAEILGTLDHPHIVRVRGLRMDMDPPFIEMDFVDGTPLDAVIKVGPTPVDKALTWMIQLSEALSYLHQRGVRHRDVKPGNVVVTEAGGVMLVDFGLATDADLNPITQDGLSFGTVSYAPPEWMDPDRLDAVQWDIYAVGVIFQELLTGKMAFPLSGQGPVRKQLLQVAMSKQKLAALDPGEGVPEAVRAVIRRTTGRDIAARPQTAEALCELLRSAEAAPDAVPTRGLWRWGVAALVAAAAVAGLLSFWPGQGPPTDGVVFVPLEAEVEPPSLGTVTVTGPEGAWVRVADMSGTLGPDGIEFAGVPVGSRTLLWAVGHGCETCFEGECGSGCGQGELSVEVSDQLGATVAVPEVPVGTLRVSVPSLEAGRGGRFKKKPWPVQFLVDGRAMTTQTPWVATAQVAAGRHVVVVAIGECTEEDFGCQQGGCPAKCSSVRREVVLPWDQKSVSVTVDAQPPEK